MPRKGYKTITVTDSIYDYFMEQYKKQKLELERKGINSFSGFVTAEFSRLMELEKKRTARQSNQES